MALQWWKVKRELARLAFQIKNFPRYLSAVPDRALHKKRLAEYERDFHKLTTLTDGEVAETGKIAIFLTYQPNGFAESVYFTLEYLVSKGYAPLVVFNSPPTQADRTRLSRLCWKMLERPNFGYDFGGYRDALRVLREAGTRDRGLLMMNDSVWFPTQGDPVADGEAMLATNNFDAIGLAQDQKVRYGQGDAVSFENRQLESYFYLFGPQIWNNPDFCTYWDSYQMNSDKSYTIKHGEVGFSKFMMARGARFWGPLKREDTLKALKDFTAPQFRIALEYSGFPLDVDPDIAQDLLARYADTPEWREEAYVFVRRFSLRNRFDWSFITAADHVFGIHYMKKNAQHYCREQRRNYLRAIDDGHIAPPPRVILSEIRAMVAEQTKNPPKDAEPKR